MLSTTICEAWGLLNQCLGLTCDEISNIFTSWNSTGELKHTYIVQTGSAVCSRKKTVKTYKREQTSSNRAQRLKVAEHLKRIPDPKQVTLSEDDRISFIETLGLAV